VLENLLTGNIDKGLDELLSLTKDEIPYLIQYYIYLLIAIIYAKNNDLEKAIQFAKLTIQHPEGCKKEYSWIILGELLLQAQDWMEAKRAFDHVLTLLEKHNQFELITNMFWLKLGINYFIGQWLDEAEYCLQKVLSNIELIKHVMQNEEKILNNIINEAKFFLVGIYAAKGKSFIAELGVNLQWIIEYAQQGRWTKPEYYVLVINLVHKQINKQ